MRQLNLKFFAVLAATLMAVTIMARAEPNAFLNKAAYTQNALVTQVQKDDKVMSRYTRHFGMTKEEVVEYFKTLRLDTLKEDGVYLVYNVPETEEVRARSMFYKKGTKVWVDQDGGIVLKASCGNPMARGTDVQTVPISADYDASTELVTRDTPLDATTETIIQTEIVPTPMDVETSALAFPVAPPMEVGTLITTVPPGGGAFNPNFLFPIAAIPFIIIDDGGGNEPVPEPATMVLLAAGGAALAARKRKQAKKN